MELGAVAEAVVVVILLSIPLMLTMWAFLDAARRPQWAWALAGRRQVAWLGVIGFGVLTVVGGVIVSSWYLLRVRPEIARVESGDLGGR